MRHGIVAVVMAAGLLFSAPAFAKSYSNATLNGFSFSRQSMQGATFSNTELNEAHFVESDLTGATFSNTELNGADFRGAVLRHVSFSNTELAGADFAGDDDEAFVARDAVLQVGLGAPVLLAAEEEVGVGVELERLARQPVERFVHG